MRIPESNHSIVNLIDQYHESKQEKPRPHMGVSQLGHECDRYLWLNFRWAIVERFQGRILRLFRRGHNEEKTIIGDLRAIGVDVRQSGGNQHRVDFGSHVSGSIDGVIMSGVPEAPNKPHIAEFKTHSKKSFDDLVKNGVQKSKYMHYIQMQIYMLGMDIDRALYVAVCKDNDHMYTERVKLDVELANRYVERGKLLALENQMPPRIKDDPTWYSCKWCPAYDFCFNEQPTKEANCRTCAFSTPKDDSTWFCNKWQDTIPTDAQYNGCDYHVVRPDLVPWELGDGGDDEWTASYVFNGAEVLNGNPKEGVFSSAELLANPDACFNADSFLNELRSKFDARVIK